MDKGIDKNVQPEKQIIRPAVTQQSHVSTQSKDQFYVKPQLGQDRAGIKKNVIRFPIPQWQDIPKQLKLLPGRKPIIQMAERPILQSLELMFNPKYSQKFHKYKSLVFW